MNDSFVLHHILALPPPKYRMDIPGQGVYERVPEGWLTTTAAAVEEQISRFAPVLGKQWLAFLVLVAGGLFILFGINRANVAMRQKRMHDTHTRMQRETRVETAKSKKSARRRRNSTAGL